MVVLMKLPSLGLAGEKGWNPTLPMETYGCSSVYWLGVISVFLDASPVMKTTVPLSSLWVGVWVVLSYLWYSINNTTVISSLYLGNHIQASPPSLQLQVQPLTSNMIMQ